jgi:putative ABC transport system ATP-binding protein
MSLFELNKVCCTLGEGESQKEVLRGISGVIEPGQVVSIVGPSGAGKSTLLNVMSGLERITSGEVLYGGQNIAALSEKQRARLRLKEFGFVFQAFHLIPSLTVYDNIVLPVAMNRKAVDREYYEELIDCLGISGLENKKALQISGGEMQRVAIARAMINKPSVLFADEPTGNLDSANGDRVFSLLIQCSKSFGQTLIYVTHDGEKAKLSDVCWHILDGVVSE